MCDDTAGIITTEMQTAKAEAVRQRKVMGKLAVAAAMRIRQETSNPVSDAFDVESGEAEKQPKSFEDEK